MEISLSSPQLFGVTSSGEDVYCYRVTRGALTLTCMDYGGGLLSLSVPDRYGKREDILLGYETLEEYERDSCWCGLLCGPVAGRLEKTSFELQGEKYRLEANHGSASLHSGSTGFSRSLWRGELFQTSREEGIRFSLAPPRGSWGFPGALEITATYLLSPRSLILLWEARSTAPILLAPAFHGYFNLGGTPWNTTEDHLLQIRGSHVMPLDEKHLPGSPLPVEGTPFDFRTPRSPDPLPWGEDPQITLARGYDHPFLLDPPEGDSNPAVTLAHPESGRCMEIFTDHPVCVFYSGGFFTPETLFRGGHRGTPALGLALEFQEHPNAPFVPELPLPLLLPGEVYRRRTEWRFSTVQKSMNMTSFLSEGRNI